MLAWHVRNVVEIEIRHDRAVLVKRRTACTFSRCSQTTKGALPGTSVRSTKRQRSLLHPSIVRTDRIPFAPNSHRIHIAIMPHSYLICISNHSHPVRTAFTSQSQSDPHLKSNLGQTLRSNLGTILLMEKGSREELKHTICPC